MPESNTAAILFPGQGANATDSRALTERHCPELLTSAHQLLGEDPFQHAESSTRYAQPAIYLASLAGWRASTQAGISAYAFAGHSLGEIAALTAAGVLAPDDALRLVILRARLMDEAATRNPGGMIAILKGSVEQAEQIALHSNLSVANYNAPGQTVLSGSLDGLESAATQAQEQGLRALRLNVSGAFHSPALTGVRDRFREALDTVPFARASKPVFSSLTATPFTDPQAQLAAALTQPVRWSETMLALKRLGAGAYLDVGPDRVLERLTARNLPEAALIDPEAVHALT